MKPLIMRLIAALLLFVAVPGNINAQLSGCQEIYSYQGQWGYCPCCGEMECCNSTWAQVYCQDLPKKYCTIYWFWCESLYSFRMGTHTECI